MDPSSIVSTVSIGVRVIGAISGVRALVSRFRRSIAQRLEFQEIYGTTAGLFLMSLCSPEAWHAAQKILQTEDSKMCLDFISAQIAQANMVAVTVCLTPNITKLVC